MNAFSDLDLSDVSTNRTLGIGVHTVTIQDAKWGPPSPGQPPVLTLELSGADGNLRDVMRPKASNEAGARISKARIKSYLIATGHHDPDNPDDINWFVNKQCKIKVEQGKSFTRDDGSIGHYRNITGVYPLDADVPEPKIERAPAQNFSAPSSMNFDDDIPF